MDPDADLDTAMLRGLRHFRQLSDRDANWPRALPVWSIAEDLGVSADEAEAAADRLAWAGLAEVTKPRMGFGPMARATDVAMALPEAPHA